MDSLHIPSSQSTPSVEADPERGLIKMTGDSYPENSFEFFDQVFAWIETYLAGSSAPLTLELRVVYMNTSSVKAMMDILELFEEHHRLGRAISVRWLYDPRNERIVELAEEFKEDCSFSFEITAEA